MMQAFLALNKFLYKIIDVTPQCKDVLLKF